MKFAVALISDDALHQQQIRNSLCAQPWFALIGCGETILQAYPIGKGPTLTPLIMVDLSHPEAAHAPFWVELHLA